MSADGNTGLIRRYLEVAQTEHLDAFDEIFSTDFVSHRPNGGEDRGPEGMKTFIAGLNARLDSMAVELAG